MRFLRLTNTKGRPVFFIFRYHSMFGIDEKSIVRRRQENIFCAELDRSDVTALCVLCHRRTFRNTHTVHLGCHGTRGCHRRWYLCVDATAWTDTCDPAWTHPHTHTCEANAKQQTLSMSTINVSDSHKHTFFTLDIRASDWLFILWNVQEDYFN